MHWLVYLGWWLSAGVDPGGGRGAIGRGGFGEILEKCVKAGAGVVESNWFRLLPLHNNSRQTWNRKAGLIPLASLSLNTLSLQIITDTFRRRLRRSQVLIEFPHKRLNCLFLTFLFIFETVMQFFQLIPQILRVQFCICLLYFSENLPQRFQTFPTRILFIIKKVASLRLIILLLFF